MELDYFSTPFVNNLLLSYTRYGFAKKAWFDGVVEVINWDRGDEVMLQITDITEYQYLKPTCSKESFYQCLARRVSKLSLEDIKSHIESSKCHVDVDTPLCLPFSLPSTIPICNKTDIDPRYIDTRKFENLCFQDLLNDMMLDQDQHCKKTCSLKEFRVTQSHDIQHHQV